MAIAAVLIPPHHGIHSHLHHLRIHFGCPAEHRMRTATVVVVSCFWECPSCVGPVLLLLLLSAGIQKTDETTQ